MSGMGSVFDWKTQRDEALARVAELERTQLTAEQAKHMLETYVFPPCVECDAILAKLAAIANGEKDPACSDPHCSYRAEAHRIPELEAALTAAGERARGNKDTIRILVARKAELEAEVEGWKRNYEVQRTRAEHAEAKLEETP